MKTATDKESSPDSVMAAFVGVLSFGSALLVGASSKQKVV